MATDASYIYGMPDYTTTSDRIIWDTLTNPESTIDEEGGWTQGQIAAVNQIGNTIGALGQQEFVSAPGELTFQSSASSQKGQALAVVGGTVSGAATGFAIGNVPGAIVGGAIGLISGLSSSSDARRERARRVRDNQDRVARQIIRHTKSTSRRIKKISSDYSKVFQSGTFSSAYSELKNNVGARYGYQQMQADGVSNELLAKSAKSYELKTENMIDGAMLAVLQKIDSYDIINRSILKEGQRLHAQRRTGSFDTDRLETLGDLAESI